MASPPRIRKTAPRRTPPTMLEQAVRAHLDPAAHLGSPLFLAPQRLSLADGPPIEAEPAAKLAASASRLETMAVGQDLGSAEAAQATQDLGELANQMRALEEGTSRPEPVPDGLDGWKVAKGFGQAALMMTPPGQVFTNVRRAYTQFPDVKKAFGGGVFGTVAGLANALPAAGLLGTMIDQYDRHGGGTGGLTMAFNEINPLWHAVDTPLRMYEAVQSGDSEATGEQGFRTAREVVGLFMMANGALGRGGQAPRPPGGMTGGGTAGGRLPGGGTAGSRVTSGSTAQMGRRLAPWVIRTSEALTETTAPGSLGGRMASGPSISSLALPEPVMPPSPLSLPPLPLPRPPTWMTAGGSLPARVPGAGLTPPARVPGAGPTPPAGVPGAGLARPQLVPTAGSGFTLPQAGSMAGPMAGVRATGPLALPFPMPQEPVAPLALPMLTPAPAAPSPLPVQLSMSESKTPESPQPVPQRPIVPPSSLVRSPESVRLGMLSRLQAWNKVDLMGPLEVVERANPLLSAAIERVYDHGTNSPENTSRGVGKLHGEALELGRGSEEFVTHTFRDPDRRKHKVTFNLRVPSEAFSAALVNRIGPKNIIYLPAAATYNANTFLHRVSRSGLAPADASAGVEFPDHGVGTHPFQIFLGNEALATDPRFANKYRTVGEVLRALNNDERIDQTTKEQLWRAVFDSFAEGMPSPEVLYPALRAELGDLDAPFARADKLLEISRMLVADNPKLNGQYKKLRKKAEAELARRQGKPNK